MKTKRRRVAAVVAAAAVAAGSVVGYSLLSGEDPGAMLDGMIKAAQPGETITVAPGSYPCQTVTYDPAKEGATQRVIVDATGATFSCLQMQGVQHVEIRGLRILGLWNVRLSTINSLLPTSKPSADLVFTRITAKVFLWRNVQGITLRDSVIGGQDVSVSGLSVPKVGAYPAENGAAELPSRNVLIERTSFQDIIRTQTNTTHGECLYLDAGIVGMIVRDSTFTNCAVFDAFSNGQTATRPITGIVFDTNLMDVPRDTVGGAAASAVNFKGGAGTVAFRGNSILGNVRRDAAPYQWTSEKNAIGGTGGTGADVMAADPGFVSASRVPCNLAACFRNDLHVIAESPAGLAGAGVPISGPPPPSPPPPPPPPPTYDMQAEYDLLESSTIHQRYVKANPGEAVVVETYWRSGGAKPTVATAYGRFLISASEEIRR